MGLATLGGMTIGLGVLVFIPVGAVVLGAALFRTGAVSRLGAALMIAAGPSILAAMLVGGAVPPIVGGLLFAGPLGAAWIAIGYDLRTTAIEPATDPTAAV